MVVSRTQERGMAQRVEDVGKSECPSVIEGIGLQFELQGYLIRKDADFRNTSQRKGSIEWSLPEEKLNDE